MANSPKHLKYKTEQDELYNKILKILDVSDITTPIDVYYTDFTTEQKEAITALSQDVKHYYSCGDWAYYKKRVPGQHPEISLIKSILQSRGISSKYTHTDNKLCLRINAT